jgi:hypothetical protein
MRKKEPRSAFGITEPAKLNSAQQNIVGVLFNSSLIYNLFYQIIIRFVHNTQSIKLKKDMFVGSAWPK